MAPMRPMKLSTGPRGEATLLSGNQLGTSAGV